MPINDHKRSETAKNLQQWCPWSCRSPYYQDDQSI